MPAAEAQEAAGQEGHVRIVHTLSCARELAAVQKRSDGSALGSVVLKTHPAMWFAVTCDGIGNNVVALAHERLGQ